MVRRYEVRMRAENVLRGGAEDSARTRIPYSAGRMRADAGVCTDEDAQGSVMQACREEGGEWGSCTSTEYVRSMYTVCTVCTLHYPILYSHTQHIQSRYLVHTTAFQTPARVPRLSSVLFRIKHRGVLRPPIASGRSRARAKKLLLPDLALRRRSGTLSSVRLAACSIGRAWLTATGIIGRAWLTATGGYEYNALRRAWTGH